ncbi:MAG: glutathione S-transferase [Hyphomicrobiales bacterium]|nr:glutathione S-transferase [Hyphomicrobiales bacterium]
MSDLPILYSFRRCPYAMRARIGILEAGIKVELREILLRDKPAHMLEISPKATVPVLLLPNGQVIDESLDIMLWALQQNDPNQLLAGDMASMLELIEQTDGSRNSHFKHHLDRYKYATRYTDDASNDDSQNTGLNARNQAEIFIQKLEFLLTEQPFLMGQDVSLADLAIAPFVRQFANSGRQWWDSTPYPNTQQWLAAFIASDRFVCIFKKLPVWQLGNTAYYFPVIAA